MTNRTEGGQWVKGQSGNPAGRSKQDGRVKDLARGFTEAALATLDEIRKNKKNGAMARVAACRELLDRGWGRPPVSVDLTNSDGSLSSAWLAALKEADIAPEEAREVPVEH